MLFRKVRLCVLAGIASLVAGCGGEEVVGFGLGTDADLEVFNETAYEIGYMRIASYSISGWGDNQLDDDESIAAGGSHTFSVDDCDQYFDLRAEDTSGYSIGWLFGLYMSCGKNYEFIVY